jgi:hypothetical protein
MRAFRSAARSSTASAFFALLCGCASGGDATLVSPTVPPVVAPLRAADVALLACDGGTPLWVATQQGAGAWTTVSTTPTGRYEITFQSGRGGLIVVDTINNAIRTTVLYMAADEFAAMIPRTDTTRTCTRRSADVTVAGLRSSDVARIGLGGGTRTISDNGITASISELGARSVSLAAARVHQGTLRADVLILRRDIPFPGPHALIDFGTAEPIALDSVPLSVTNTLGQPVTVGMSILSHTVGGASVELDRTIIGADGTVQMRRVPPAFQASGDIHAAFAQTNFPDPRQVVSYVSATARFTLSLGPALALPTVSAAGPSRPRMQLPAQAEYATAAQASFFQGTRSLSVIVSARYLGALPATWDLTPPDLAGVAGWNPAWALTPTLTVWQANGFGGLLGSEPRGAAIGRVSTFALQQGAVTIF